MRVQLILLLLGASFWCSSQVIKPIKWHGEDEYLSDYQRSGFQIRFLERVQIFVSQKIIKFINPVYFSERNFSK